MKRFGGQMKWLILMLSMTLASCAPKVIEDKTYDLCVENTNICPLNNDPPLYYSEGRNGCVSRDMCESFQ